MVGLSPKKLEMGGVAPTASPPVTVSDAVLGLGAVHVEPGLQVGRAADGEGSGRAVSAVCDSGVSWPWKSLMYRMVASLYWPGIEAAGCTGSCRGR